MQIRVVFLLTMCATGYLFGAEKIGTEEKRKEKQEGTQSRTYQNSLALPIRLSLPNLALSRYNQINFDDSPSPFLKVDKSSGYKSPLSQSCSPRTTRIAPAGKLRNRRELTDEEKKELTAYEEEEYEPNPAITIIKCASELDDLENTSEDSPRLSSTSTL